MEVLEKISDYKDIKELDEDKRKMLANFFVSNLNPHFIKYLYSVISFAFVDGDNDNLEYIFKELGGDVESGL